MAGSVGRHHGGRRSAANTREGVQDIDGYVAKKTILHLGIRHVVIIAARNEVLSVGGTPAAVVL